MVQLEVGNDLNLIAEWSQWVQVLAIHQCLLLAGAVLCPFDDGRSQILLYLALVLSINYINQHHHQHQQQRMATILPMQY